MRYHLFKKFFGKMVKIKETSFLSTREDTNFLPPLYIQLVLMTLQAHDAWQGFLNLRDPMPKPGGTQTFEMSLG